MANPPPPYDNITGISRTVMKDNAQETLGNYNGNARPGEIVLDLTVDPPTPYVGNNLGQLTLLTSAGSYGNTQVGQYLAAGLVGNIIPSGNGVYSLGNSTNWWSNLWVAGNTLYIGGVPVGMSGNVLTVNNQPVLSNNSNTSISTTGNITADYFLGNIEGLIGNITNLNTLNFDVTNISAQIGNNGVNIGAGGYNNLVVLPTEVTVQNVPLYLTEANLVGTTTPYNAGYLRWMGNSSGDGSGYTTLQLIPDETVTASDQYLIIDPTAPGHIHIRAGGTQDNSSAELYLGGENSYFKVASGSNPDVSISANSKTWTYHYGALGFPVLLYADLTAIVGSRAFINDANLVAASNFGAQVSGGGSNAVPVWSDGINWYIG